MGKGNRKSDQLLSDSPFPISDSRYLISRLFSLLPAFNASLNQRGRLPRPDQVIEGSAGLRYFGATLPRLPRRPPRPPYRSAKVKPSALISASTLARTLAARSLPRSPLRAFALRIYSSS